MDYSCRPWLLKLLKTNFLFVNKGVFSCRKFCVPSTIAYAILCFNVYDCFSSVIVIFVLQNFRRAFHPMLFCLHHCCSC